MNISLYNGDCLELMKTIDSESINLILCDLPYGTTGCKWDSIIPFDLLWKQYNRIIKRNGVIALFCSQPFTTKLISSNYEMFKFCWYYEKPKGANFALTGYQPLKVIEEIAIFSKSASTYTKSGNSMVYNPQKIKLDSPKSRKIDNRNVTNAFMEVKPVNHTVIYEESTPRNLLYASHQKDGRVHPTQKPVELCEYFIKTYSNEFDVVLDNTMGSGTTGVACVNTNRNFIGIEKELGYFEIAQTRIKDAQEKVEEVLAGI